MPLSRSVEADPVKVIKRIRHVPRDEIPPLKCAKLELYTFHSIFFFLNIKKKKIFKLGGSKTEGVKEEKGR